MAAKNAVRPKHAVGRNASQQLPGEHPINTWEGEMASALHIDARKNKPQMKEEVLTKWRAG